MKAMAGADQIRWGHILAGGFLAETLVVAIVMPVSYLFGDRWFVTSILVASALLPFLFAAWVGRRVESRFMLHGTLVGAVAALIYLGLAWGEPQLLVYKVAHSLKLLGGALGGLAAASRKARELVSA